MICDVNTFGTGPKKKKYLHGFVEDDEKKKIEPNKPPNLEYRCLDYLTVMKNDYYHRGKFYVK